MSAQPGGQLQTILITFKIMAFNQLFLNYYHASTSRPSVIYYISVKCILQTAELQQCQMCYTSNEHDLGD